MSEKSDPKDYMVTVRDVMSWLSEQDPDSYVITRARRGDDGYSPLRLDGSGPGIYLPANTWSGEWLEEDEVEEEDEDSTVAAVFLVPIH